MNLWNIHTLGIPYRLSLPLIDLRYRFLVLTRWLASEHDGVGFLDVYLDNTIPFWVVPFTDVDALTA
jgi:hypothetical protein